MLTYLCSAVDVNLFTISILFYFRLLAYDCLSLGISFDHLSRERRLYAEISLRTALLFSRSERSIWGQILAKWRVLIGGNCRKRFSAYRRPLLWLIQWNSIVYCSHKQLHITANPFRNVSSAQLEIFIKNMEHGIKYNGME